MITNAKRNYEMSERLQRVFLLDSKHDITQLIFTLSKYYGLVPTILFTTSKCEQLSDSRPISFFFKCTFCAFGYLYVRE